MEHCLQVPAVSGRPGHSGVSTVPRGVASRIRRLFVEASAPSKELQQLVETLQMLPEMDKRSGVVGWGFGVSCGFLWFLVGLGFFSKVLNLTWEILMWEVYPGTSKVPLGGFEA